MKLKGIEYTYKIKDGVSKLRGGVGVLRNLNYPKKYLHHKNNVRFIT